jgi:Mg2+ and Co2+ transporter CorA
MTAPNKAGAAGQAAALPHSICKEPLMTDSMNTDATDTRACRWLMLDPVARHLAVTQDIAAGIATVLELVEREGLAAEDASLEAREYTPTLMPHEIDELMKLVIAASRSLAEQAERMQQWAGKHGTEVPRAAQNQA